MTGSKRSMAAESDRTIDKGDTCPAGGAALIPIVYGFPGGDMIEQAEHGNIKLGGCSITGNDPQFSCQGLMLHYWHRGPRGQLVGASGTEQQGWSDLNR